MHVNCRTGSLEIFEQAEKIGFRVNCRTGSLEKLQDALNAKTSVNCRTGSLEIDSIVEMIDVLS